MNKLYFVGSGDSTFLKYVFYSQKKLGIDQIFVLEGNQFVEAKVDDMFMSKRFNTIVGAQLTHQVVEVVRSAHHQPGNPGIQRNQGIC